MKNLLKISTITFCFLLLTNVCFAQQIDLGKVCQRTYTNNFFGLKIEFPKGWLVSDSETQSLVNKLSEGNLPLVAGYHFTEDGLSEDENFRVIATDLKSVVLKTPQDFLNGMKMIIEVASKETEEKTEFSEIKSATIGGQSFEYLDVKLDDRLNRFYVIIKNGYFLSITIEADNKKDFDEYIKIAEKISFDNQNQI